MAIAYNGSAGNATSADPCNITPAASANDVIVAAATADSSGATVDSLAGGFVQQALQACTAEGNTLVVATKATATGSEGSIAPVNMSLAAIAVSANFSGVNNTTPLNQAAVIVNQNTASASPLVVDTGTITPTVDGCMIVAIMATDATAGVDVTTTFSTISGTTGAWTKAQDIWDSSFDNLSIGYALQTTAGPISVRASNASSNNMGGTLVVLVLQPASAAAPVAKRQPRRTKGIRRNFDLAGWFNPRAGLNGWFWRGWASSASPNVTRNLTGSAITSAQGSVAASLSAAISGQAATGSAGTVNASQPLAGSAASSAAGIVAPSSAIPLTGSAASASAGTAAPSISVALSGQAISAAQGSVAPGLSVSLAGSAAAGSAGTISPQSSVAITGSAASASAGTIVPANSVPLSGQAATGAQGTVTVDASSGVTVALSGQAITTASGSIVAALSAAISGGAASGQAGALTANTARGISGQSASAAAGSAAATNAPGLAGAQSSAASGVIAARLSVSASGQAANAAQGNVTPTLGNVVDLVGQQFAAAQGALVRLLYARAPAGGGPLAPRNPDAGRPASEGGERPAVISGARPDGINGARPGNASGRRP